MGVTLRDFMTSDDVLTVPAETSLREAARVMRGRNVGAAVVVDGGRIAASSPSATCCARSPTASSPTRAGCRHT